MKTTNRNLYLKILVMIAVCSMLVGCTSGSISDTELTSDDLQIVESISLVGAVEVIKGLQSALNGATGTGIYQNAESIVFFWPKGSTYEYAVFSREGGIMPGDLTGVRVSVFELIKTLKGATATGWSQISPKDVPTILTTTIVNYSVLAIEAGSQILPTFFVMPMIMLETPEPEFY